MKKIWKWLKESNRAKHLAYGAAVGAGANDAYCAAYAGAGVASALEFKDRQWGGRWDWVDWSLTVAGVAAGYAARHMIMTNV